MRARPRNLRRCLQRDVTLSHGRREVAVHGRNPSSEGRCASLFRSIHRQRNCCATTREHRATVNARASYGGDAMPDPLCRLSVSAAWATRWILALPNGKRRSACYCLIVDLIHRGRVADDEDDTGIYRGGQSGSIRREACATMLFATANSCCSRHRPPQRPNGCKRSQCARWSTPSTLARVPTQVAATRGMPVRLSGATAFVWSGVVTSATTGHVVTGGAVAAAASERSRCDAPTQTRSSASR